MKIEPGTLIVQKFGGCAIHIEFVIERTFGQGYDYCDPEIWLNVMRTAVSGTESITKMDSIRESYYLFYGDSDDYSGIKLYRLHDDEDAA